MVAAATVFRVIQRDVRVLQQLLGIRAVFRIDADTDARAGKHSDAVEIEWNYERPANSIRDRVDHLCVGQHVRDDHELVSAHSNNDIVRGDGGAQAVGDSHQQLVAGPMTQRVVYILEMIQVYVQKSQAALIARGALDQSGQQLLQIHA